ncbi:MAG: sensor histidine kinase [Elusimicrobia bacterium]|nr:sensor histidine kinase [Elusimicrobiota bacterium]
MRNAFVVLFVTAAVPLIAALGWFSSQSSGRREVAFQLHREVAGLAATTVARHLDVLEGRLEYLKQFYPALAQGGVDAVAAEKIQKALRLNPDFLAMLLVDKQGREIRRWGNSPSMKNFGELERAARPAVERAAATERPASALAALAQAPALVAVQPVGGGRFACVGVSLEGLWNELARHRLGAGGLTTLVTAEGRLLPVPGQTLPRVDAAYLSKLLQTGDRGWSESIPAPEGPYVGMFERIANAGLADWYALTLELAAEAAPGASRFWMIAAGFGLFTFALSLAGTMMLAAPAAEIRLELKRSREREASLEAKLKRMPDAAEERELAQAKEEFFLSAAHDFRAPLFAVQGYLRLIERSIDPDPRVKGYFEAVHQSCEKLTLLIQDILDSSRLETGQLKLGVSAIGPKVFLERVQRLFGALAAEKGVGLDVKVDETVPAEIDADERLLERVFANLVSNALNVLSRGGRITLAARTEGDGVECSVADNGPGVPEEDHKAIFDKFAQPGAAKRGGFGLGLHICKKIVELHRGVLRLESQVGRGSRFIFRIPTRQIV